MAQTREHIHFDHKGIGDVLTQNRLQVPLNQREYSWEDEHIEDLFSDLASAIASDRNHFLGTIVLTKGGTGLPEVSDGQQRLATSTILLAAIRDWFYLNEDIDRSNAIEQGYLRRFELAEGSIVPRLTLNIEDNHFFSSFILPQPGDPKRELSVATKDSHKRIQRAAEIARKRVLDIVSLYDASIRPRELVRWVEFVSARASVIILNVPDDVDAFMMFETLNDRGLKASQADLLKNFLLSQTRGREAEAQQHWAQMTGILQSLGHDDSTVSYLHHLLITQHGPTRAAEIFDRVKSHVSGQVSAMRFLDSAASGATDYAALFNSDHKKWNAYGSSTKKHISTINRDLRVHQIRPLMLAVARHFSVREAQLAFRMFVFWSVRFLVVGGRGGLLDRNYALAAADVGTQKIQTADELMQSLSNIIPSDALFKAAFADVRVSSAYLARYYLRALERQANGELEPEWIPSEDESEINLEHILPGNPLDEWQHIPTEIASAYHRRLGNMVLLQASKNTMIGNQSFDAKRPTLLASDYSLTREVASSADWRPDEITIRQARLAELAVFAWPIKLP